MGGSDYAEGVAVTNPVPPTETAKDKAVKNKLSDLNNHLFAQIERLGDEELTDDEIGKEAKRAEAIVSVADQIIRNADLQLKASALLANHGYHFAPHLDGIAPGAEVKRIGSTQ